MISKVFTGHSFYGSVQYVHRHERHAVILKAEGVREHDYKLMIKDFELQQELRPSKRQACFHGILSFYPGENPGDAAMLEIAKKYLQDIGIRNTQYVITKHADKDHLHLHIIANMINNEGQIITDSYIGLRGKKAAQRLTQQYKLIPALEKNPELTHLESLSRSEANRYQIYIAIRDLLPVCNSMEELEKKLFEKNIEVQYKYKGQTTEKQGISFRKDNDCFKGSKIDRRFSFNNLEKTISLQQRQMPEQKQMQPMANLIRDNSFYTTTKKVNQEKAGLRLSASKLLDDLMKPEEQNQPTPDELLKEQRRKRKKQSHKI